MSGNVISVSVQWALRGRSQEYSGYRVLARSHGPVRSRNFEEILDRFSPGTLQALPQVTINHFLAGEDGSRYLGMAFHEPDAEGIDRFGRDVTVTRYFCFPYQEVASAAVTYQAMYEALRGLRLPETGGSSLTVELAPGEPVIPADAARALPVSRLLLTGNPVCITGAGATTVAERLAFIDSVMSLLPYGMRAEMAAATWASSIWQHRLRLFFSSTPRNPTTPALQDHVVAWRPNGLQVIPASRTRIDPAWGDEYMSWLQPMVDVGLRLAGQNAPIPFRRAEIARLVTQRRAESRQTGAAEATEDSVHRDHVEELLTAFARDLNDEKIGVIDSALEQLAVATEKASPTDAQRIRYQATIKNHALLREDLPLGRNRETFYRVLLRAAFGHQVSYPDYLRIRAIMDGEPHKSLLQVIDDASTDQRVRFIARYHLNDNRYPRSELAWERLIAIAADSALSEQDAAIVWAATIEALRRTKPTERDAVRDDLCQRGFLAAALRTRAPDDLPYQVNAICGLLQALYGDRLDRDAYAEIFTGSRNTPAEAVFIAACKLIDADNLEHLLFYYLQGIARSPELGLDIRAGLVTLGFGAGDDDEGAALHAPRVAEVAADELTAGSAGLSVDESPEKR